jgi:hypothetical protein
MGMISMAWMVVPSASPIQPGSGILILTPPWLAVASIDDLSTWLPAEPYWISGLFRPGREAFASTH